jgi:nitrogen-specific signal transduction histidine kinase
MIGDGDEDEVRFDWRRGGAAAAGLVAALILVVMVFMVKFANDARENALDAERHTYEVALVVRNASANIAQSEAALARFVLDEDVRHSGNIYASDWQLAGYQIDQLTELMQGSPNQQRRLTELKGLYAKRGAELSLAARAALAKQGDAGIRYFYQAARDDDQHVSTGHLLNNKLEEIINAERSSMRNRIEQSEFFSDQADQFTNYLSWLGVIVGLGAIFLGVVAVQALRQYAITRKQVETESDRAEALELAVRDRTQELWEANQALKAEGAEREAAEAQLRQVQKMEAVGQLTGGIAHDFNNMLAVVVGGIDLALRRLNGPRREVMMHLNNAMEGATRAAALTRRLLSFARSEPLLPERVDSIGLIGGMSDLLDRTLGERIRIEVDLDRDAWPIYVDPHQLENAIVNLAVNARDAMEGEGLMRVATENVRRRLCEDQRHRHGLRNAARSARARLRTILHDQTRRQGHGARAQPDFRLCSPVRRRGRHRKPGRTRDHRLDLPAPHRESGRSPDASGGSAHRSSRRPCARCPNPSRRGRSARSLRDRRCARGPRL